MKYYFCAYKTKLSLMKKKAQKTLSDYLIKGDLRNFSVQNLKESYNQFKTEVEINIDKAYNYNDLFKYLMELRFYFEEIKKGYYQNIQTQLELFSDESFIIKKKHFIPIAISE